MKPGSILASYYTSEELRTMAQLSCSRTISTAPEITLKPSMFCQPIDIGIDLVGNCTQDILDMKDYPLRSLQNAVQYSKVLLEAGIHTVMIRMDAPSAYVDRRKLLEKQVSIIRSLRAAFAPSALRIIVDPFSAALNPDKTWGIQSNGQLDYMRTAEFFSLLTQCFAEAGADYILTLGRFEREADIAVRTLKAHGSNAQVSSFSTNTETTNAYVYSNHQTYATTGQKILVANYNEMVLRALLDVYEGSKLVIIKPAENLHVLEKVTTLLSSRELLSEFLDSGQVKSIITQAAHLRVAYQNITSDTRAFGEKAQLTHIGCYTVSGTYYMDMQTRDRKGGDFLKSLLYERFVNAAAVMSPRGEPLIIDRNAGWFWMNQTRLVV